MRLLAVLMGVIAVGVPVAAVALFFTAIIGSPGSCDGEGRAPAGNLALAASFQEKWDRFNDDLNAGRDASTVRFDEGETTSRAQLWLDEHDAPVSRLAICFGVEGGSASGKVNLPFVPGDVDVLVRGTMGLTGEHPEVKIEDIEVGGLPEPFTNLVEGFVTDLIADETDRLLLTRDYGLSFSAGEVTVSGGP